MTRSAGFTKGPCPACRKGEQHPTGDICSDCRNLHSAAKKIVEAHNRQQVEAWFQYGEVYHWNPSYYLGCEISEEARTRLHKAIDKVVRAGATAEYRRAREDGLWPVNGWQHLKKMPEPLIHRAEGLPDKNGSAGGGMVLMRFPLAEAINELDAAIIGALVSVAAESVEKGSNLIASLARGDLTLDDFNKDVAESVKRLRAVERSSKTPIPSKRRKPTRDER